MWHTMAGLINGKNEKMTALCGLSKVNLKEHSWILGQERERGLQLYLVWYDKAVAVLRRVEMSLDTDAVPIIINIITSAYKV